MTEIEKMAEVIKNTLVVLPSESELIAHGFGMPTQQDEGAYKLRIFDREDYIRKQLANVLVKAGYRKQEDVVKEFAEKVNRKAEIECDSDFNISIYNLEALTETIAAEFGVEE